MASKPGWSDAFSKHEAWASSIPVSAWYLLGSYVVEDGLTRHSVYAGMMLVSAVRAICLQIVGWETYLGVDTSTSEQYPSIDSPGQQLPILTLAERVSVWLVPLGYLVVGALELETGLAHGSAAGVAGAIGTGVVYRRIRKVELLVRASDQ